MIGGRFGRRRRTEERRAAPIDESWLGRAATALSAGEVRRLELDAVPPSFALLGLTEAGGRRFLLAVTPGSGGDALLAALVAETHPEAEGAEIVAAAPHFDAASRRRLGALRGPVRTLELGGAEPVVPELPTPVVPVECLAAPLVSARERAVFERALAGLRGLAAKHGGSTRSARAGLELVILARPVAWLRAGSDRVRLELLAPETATIELTEANLGEALDRLEGGVRRRVADRRVQGSEEGLRGRLAPQLAEPAALGFAVRWPFAGAGQAIDLVGVDANGTAVIGFVRERLSLTALGEALDAALAAEPLLPLVLREAKGPVQISDRPRLAFAFREAEAGAEAVLARLALASTTLRADGDALRPEGEVAPTRQPEAHQVAPTRQPDAQEGPREPGRRRRRRRGRGRDRDDGRDRDREDGREPERESRGYGREAERESRGAREPERESPRYAGEPERESPRYAGEPERESRDGGRPARAQAEEEPLDAFTLGEADEEPAPAARFDDVVDDAPQASGALELSLFDLGDEPSENGESGGARRRGRRRGRGRRGRRGAEGASDDEEPAPARGRAAGGQARAEEPDDDDDDDEAELALSPDAPELDEEPAAPAYDDEEEGEPESEVDRIRQERERRRRDRHTTLVELGPEPARETEVAGDEPSTPRGRAAIVAHADRDSIAAAVLLARDMRQLEGLWVYPQSELMTFFRGVATDLRENTPIYVVGFVPRPSRDVLQAAALYRGRLVWFDHHDWPPEDLLALRDSLGASLVRVVPGAGSSLPAVLPFCQRRSRFSDKFVDLVCGRFTPHDFQRWGRLWWWRLGELAKKPGEHRAALEGLIAGRPSDLAREAERAAAPPPPEELAWVASRDFRLVHFGGLGLVVTEVPTELDLSLALRLVRERHGVPLALARHAGSEAFVLAADESSAGRSFDLGGMVEHLAGKFSWVEALPDDDHMARLRLRNVDAIPDRLDEVIAEIGMSRALLEG